MEISSANSAAQVAQDQTQTNNTGNSLGKNEFLELLLTQLKNQDPLEPMENKEFIAQMAQFSSLEQMQNMNASMEKFLQRESISQAASLVGKTIEKTAESGEEDEIIKGEVARVNFEAGDTYVVLEDGTKINTEDISSIY